MTRKFRSSSDSLSSSTNGKLNATVNTEISVKLALVSAKFPLRALADVVIRWSDGEITLRRCTVFAKPGEPAWATLPQMPVEKHGKKHYIALVDLPRDLKQRVLEAVLGEYKRSADVPS
jgi:hypothetical protein